MTFRWCTGCNDVFTLKENLNPLHRRRLDFCFPLCIDYPPKKRTWLAGKSTIWRSISYWKWWFSNVMLVFQGILSRESASCCFFNSEYIMVELNQVFTKTMAFCHPMHRIMQEYLETFAAHSWSPTTALQCSPGTVNRSVEEFSL